LRSFFILTSSSGFVGSPITGVPFIFHSGTPGFRSPPVRPCSSHLTRSCPSLPLGQKTSNCLLDSPPILHTTSSVIPLIGNPHFFWSCPFASFPFLFYQVTVLFQDSSSPTVVQASSAPRFSSNPLPFNRNPHSTAQLTDPSPLHSSRSRLFMRLVALSSSARSYSLRLLVASFSRFLSPARYFMAPTAFVPSRSIGSLYRLP